MKSSFTGGCFFCFGSFAHTRVCVYTVGILFLSICLIIILRKGFSSSSLCHRVCGANTLTTTTTTVSGRRFFVRLPLFGFFFWQKTRSASEGRWTDGAIDGRQRARADQHEQARSAPAGRSPHKEADRCPNRNEEGFSLSYKPCRKILLHTKIEKKAFTSTKKPCPTTFRHSREKMPKKKSGNSSPPLVFIFSDFDLSRFVFRALHLMHSVLFFHQFCRSSFA